MPRKLWFALDATFCADPKIQHLGAEFGPAGPLVIAHLLGAAKVQDEAGRVTIAYKALAYATYLKRPVVARQIVARATEQGILRFVSFDDDGFVGFFPEWGEWQIADTGAAARQRRRRDKKRDKTVTSPVTRHAPDRDITRDSSVTHIQSTDTDTERAKALSSEIDFAGHSKEAISLCETLRDLVAGNGSKAPLVSAQWLSSARLLLERDERPYAEAMTLVRWSQADEFWRTNVLSMPTFRKQYDRLRLRAQQQPTRHLKAVDKVAEDLERYERIAQELEAGDDGDAA